MRDHRRQRGGNFVEELIQSFFWHGRVVVVVIPDAMRSLALVDREPVLIQPVDFKFGKLAKAEQFRA